VWWSEPCGKTVLQWWGGVDGFWDCLERLKRFQNKIIQSGLGSLTYTTYKKTLIKLTKYVRKLNLEEVDGFLINMQTLDDTITDFIPNNIK